MIDGGSRYGTLWRALGAVSLGIAVLAPVASVGHRLELAFEKRTVPLIATLAAFSRDTAAADEDETVKVIKNPRTTQMSFSFWIFFPKDGRRARVPLLVVNTHHADLQKHETQPPEAWERFKRGGCILATDSFIRQFGVKPGEPIRLDRLSATIAGSVADFPVFHVGASAQDPGLYLSMDDLLKSGLYGHTAQKMRTVRHNSFYSGVPY